MDCDPHNGCGLGPAGMDRAQVIDDQTLTTDGLAQLGKGRVLLLACGALAHEIIALKKMNSWDHLDLQCLPAIFHNHPERIIPAITDAVAKHRDFYDNIFVVYADCGTGGQLFENHIVLLDAYPTFYMVTSFFIHDSSSVHMDSIFFIWISLSVGLEV